jgi:hypothetical protein
MMFKMEDEVKVGVIPMPETERGSEADKEFWYKERDKFVLSKRKPRSVCLSP